MKWTKRELQEIYHALFYESTTKHGTVGHNQLLIMAKLAKADGFNLFSDDGVMLYHNDYGVIFSMLSNNIDCPDEIEL